jgi:hypothetical protein
MRRPTKTEQIQIRVTRVEKRDLLLRARAAGLDLSSWILGRLSPPHAVNFRELVTSLAAAQNPSDVFAEIGHLLSALRRDQLSAAVEVLPPVQLGAVTANQLAAMVELRAARLGVRPPTWTEQIQPLPEPWFPTTLVSVRLDLLCNSPPRVPSSKPVRDVNARAQSLMQTSLTREQIKELFLALDSELRSLGVVGEVYGVSEPAGAIRALPRASQPPGVHGAARVPARDEVPRFSPGRRVSR